ncbi:GNAT family N-acetyltransferase [Kitasatospora sp. NPDC096147]|uniref:GNAT family N-acetyltransferase n=1 Tax=Kitasatospora sp. NPDC096147 TaxID=3364093 RepID=UPI003809608F
MQIRPTTAQDLDLFVETLYTAFARFPDGPADGPGGWFSALEPERGLLALDQDGRAIGTASAYTFELTLPGGALAPVSGVTAVGVLPSHRRRGVLTALMRRQLTELRARGEHLAVLLCSEAVIYRRFGYGPATFTGRLTVDRARAALAPPRAAATAATAAPGSAPGTGSIEVLRRSQCTELLEQVYDRYRRTRPGALSRPPRWWARGGGQPPVAPAARYVAVHRAADGTPDGYAAYSLNEPDTLLVDETIAADDAVVNALTAFLLGHDLVARVVFKHFAPDHPLRWQLADTRAAEATHYGDWLWARVLDVPGALTARGWQADGELVLDVTDPFLGEHHRLALTTRSGEARCTPTERPADLTLDISDLGAILLGGTAPTTLVRAGHVLARTTEAAATADALFRAEREPHCLHWF